MEDEKGDMLMKNILYSDKVKPIAARTLWTIEAMLCQNVFDLGEATDEELKGYYIKMRYYFQDFAKRFDDLCQA